MKFCQSIEYNKKFFYKYLGENEAQRLVPDHCLFFKKGLYEAKGSSFDIF